MSATLVAEFLPLLCSKKCKIFCCFFSTFSTRRINLLCSSCLCANHERNKFEEASDLAPAAFSLFDRNNSFLQSKTNVALFFLAKPQMVQNKLLQIQMKFSPYVFPIVRTTSDAPNQAIVLLNFRFGKHHLPVRVWYNIAFVCVCVRACASTLSRNFDENMLVLQKLFN